MGNENTLYWIIGIIVVTTIICLTVIYINSNAWTVRFEMDNNMLEAVKSIDWSVIQNKTN